MTESISDETGVLKALKVAENGAIPFSGEADAKLLYFLLHDGECNVEISGSKIYVWYSWLQRAKPSVYFARLAPGVIGRLM
jgi:hypothetical protein